MIFEIDTGHFKNASLQSVTPGNYLWRVDISRLRCPIAKYIGDRAPQVVVQSGGLSEGVMPKHVSVAVLIPCYNESITIAAVIRDFRKSLPDASVYVYDNNSTDDTVEIAIAEGAIVRNEEFQGKGNVVRRMFAEIEADVYLMTDGDDTYDAEAAPALVEKLVGGRYDLVNAIRTGGSVEAYRRGHRLGNTVLTGLVRWFFGAQSRDMLSGYKAFSRRFVKSFPIESSGFEIETELLVHALEMRVPIAEIEAPYKERPVGSTSKLRTIEDGLRILRIIAYFIKEERPMLFFGGIAAALALAALGLGLWVIVEFMETGLVLRFPTAILSVGLTISSLLSLMTGIILSGLARLRRQTLRLAYLSVPGRGA
jgi:glycosyltransferase involved in cell wall biosynthesis